MKLHHTAGHGHERGDTAEEMLRGGGYREVTISMKQINGWHLPGKDDYFPRFVEGTARKQNGFQREHLQLAFAKVRAWDIAIDVGAHVGFWTLDMAARFDMVLAFEPSPDTYECLVKNMAEFPNVICAQAAVGDRTGECAMLDDPERMAIGKPTNTGARFVDPNGSGTRMLRLDDLEHDGLRSAQDRRRGLRAGRARRRQGDYPSLSAGHHHGDGQALCA